MSLKHTHTHTYIYIASNAFSSHGVIDTANSPISCSEANFFDSRPGGVLTCLIWSVVFVSGITPYNMSHRVPKKVIPNSFTMTLIIYAS